MGASAPAHDPVDESVLTGEEDPRPCLAAVTVERDDGPDRTTVFPAQTDREDQTTVWLSADADAFVDLDEQR